MYKLCIFDMDGTLVDSIKDIGDAMNRSLVTLGHDTYTEADYCKMVGDGMRVLCERALPTEDTEELERLIELYKEDYLENCCVRSKLYDGIDNLLVALKESGMKLAVLSNKPHNQVLKISDKLFVPSLFDKIMGNTDKFPPKPAKESLIYLMNEFNVKPEETVYIGDSDVDMILGKNADVYTIGALWGFRGEEELMKAGADAAAKNADELKKLILK